MNFLWLEYFMVAAEERSFRKAAKRLYVSEQAISEILKKLEQEMGAQLIRRTRPQTLTPAGETFYRYTRELLDLRSRMVTEITENYVVSRKDTVRVGISIFGAPSFLPQLIQNFQERYPGYRVVVVKQETYSATNFSGADLYFPPIPLDDSLEHIILLQDHICVVVHQALLERTFCAQGDKTCSNIAEYGGLASFEALPFVDVQRPNGQESRLKLICRRMGFHPSAVIWADSLQTSLSLCADGYGAIVIMEDSFKRELSHLPEEKAADLRSFMIPACEKDTILAIGYQKGKTLTSIEQQFIQVAQEFFAPQSN